LEARALVRREIGGRLAERVPIAVVDGRVAALAVFALGGVIASCSADE
jgi:hypothetical protein